MCVVRILFLVLLTSVGVSAQSLPDQNSISAQLEIRGLVAPPEFRAGDVPAASQNVEKQNRTGLLRWLPQFSEPADEELLSSLTPGTFPEVCYSMRIYRVMREDPRSDITTSAGYSECETATRFQMKAVGNEAMKP